MAGTKKEVKAPNKSDIRFKSVEDRLAALEAMTEKIISNEKDLECAGNSYDELNSWVDDLDKIVQRTPKRSLREWPKPESKVSPGRPGGKGKGSPDKRWDKGDKFMTPLRAKKAVGGAAKIVPKITKRFLDFIKTGKHVDKHGVKTNVPKAAERLTGKPHVDHGKRKRIKHLGKGKASGGRIGLQHGSRPKPTGPHTWVRKKPKGVKIAIKGL